MMRIRALMEPLNAMTKSITQKYRFNGGLFEAMESFSAHRGDATVARLMAPIASLVSGRNPMMEAGRIQSMDVFAQKFANATSVAAKRAVLKEAEDHVQSKLTTSGKLTKPLAKFYLETMRSVIKQGPQWVEESANKLLAETGPDSQKKLSKKDTLKKIKRLNILGTFFTRSELEKIMKAKQAQMAKQKKEL